MPSDSKLSELLSTIEAARVLDLEQPRTIGMPCFPSHWPGYNFALHRRHEPGPETRTSAAGFVYSAEHVGTHIDAFSHQAENMEMCGGLKATSSVQTPTGFTDLGVETIAPIVRRGILIDLAKEAGEPLPARHLVTADDLQRVVDQQQIEVHAGDVLLVRVGWGPRWTEPEVYMNAPGMDREAAEWAAANKFFAVGADNMSWDLPGYVDPVLGFSLPAHAILLVRSGIHIIENMLLEELSQLNAREFLFVCAPIKHVGGTGSPVRPLAIVP
jgi:kynurenine formamidase